MVKPIPKWLMIKYARLWREFHNNDFTNEEATAVLGDSQLVNVVVHELRKAEWLETRDDPKDPRKSIYRLHKPDDTVGQIEV